MDEVKPDIYEYYIGMQYEVIGFARDSETLEEKVVYRAPYYSEKFWDNAL